MSKELRDSRQQRPVVFCLAGDATLCQSFILE